METWQAGFAPHGITVAQVLLTHEDLRSRARYLGVKETLAQVIAYGAVPVINENDAVSAAEIRFGDNDTLSAMVASLVGAQYLLILSTAPGLVDLRGTGRVVPVVERITPEIEAMAGGTTSETAVGGMVSKLYGRQARDQVRLRGLHSERGGARRHPAPALAGSGPGTFFVPSGLPIEARKRWLAYFQRPSGAITVNAPRRRRSSGMRAGACSPSASPAPGATSRRATSSTSPGRTAPSSPAASRRSPRARSRRWRASRATGSAPSIRGKRGSRSCTATTSRSFEA